MVAYGYIKRDGMHIMQPYERPDSTPASMFAAKYAWLLRWALHFSHNDRPAAEDLVQDTFLRVLISWDKLYHLHNPEPLLYSHLRYAYLTERRKGKSYAFQSLSVLDADTLSIGIYSSSSFDRIEVQNELRSILQFLLWRRNSAKFASVFLLRFFHGYFPEEIAAISRVTRHSVDLSLRQARAELKEYLLQPRHSGAPVKQVIPEITRPSLAIPVNEFVDELKHLLFRNSRDICPTSDDLRQRYLAKPYRAIECQLLAHISTCKSCLNLVTTLCGAPPPSARSMEDSLGPASRTKHPHSSDAADVGSENDTAEELSLSRSFGDHDTGLKEIGANHYGGQAQRQGLWRLWITRLYNGLQPGNWPIVLTATCAVLLLVTACWLHVSTTQNRTFFRSDLEKAANTERKLDDSHRPGVVHQQVEIRVGGRSIPRDIYRDVDGHLRPKKQRLSRDVVELKQELASAGMQWDDPLSAADFLRWHDQLAHAEDRIDRSGSNLLVLTTETNGGGVRSESMTLRADSLRPVARRVVLADHATIEVAELSYEFVPWAMADPAWFDQLPLASTPAPDSRQASSSHRMPDTLSESQLDVALLSAQLALQTLPADTERLTVSRSPGGIRIDGIVESDSRKHEIMAPLSMIPHLSVRILSYHELASLPSANSTTTSIKAESVLSQESLLDQY